jgi:hypothetical protein
MATLWIIEYERMARDADGHIIPVGMEPAVAVQAVATSGTSAQSAALNERTRFVALITDAASNFLFGDDPTADAGDPLLPASTEIYRGVGRTGLKIAAKTVA